MLLERARAGFAGLTVAQAVQDAALTRLERWLADPTAAETFPVIHALADAGRWELLLDSFYQIIPFGTGGRRGPVGIGPNRINPWTLGTSIQGHCVYLRQRFGEGPLSVVIAYDVRRYLDTRGHSPAGVPNPVLGLSSRDFAEQAAGIYAANGITVRILARDSGTYLSTPELSFRHPAVRRPRWAQRLRVAQPARRQRRQGLRRARRPAGAAPRRRARHLGRGGHRGQAPEL
jgi:phosphoglucomutase